MPVLTDVTHGYLSPLLASDDPILREMEMEAVARKFPIIGPQSGRVLYLIAKLAAARRIFEMGSGFGYSTFWFCRALPPDGEIHHTEGDPANSEKAKNYLRRGGHFDKVRFHVGDARDALRTTPGEFDVILCDVDKDQYPECHHLAVERLRPGGVMITDNMMFHEQVADPAVETDWVKGIREFTALQLRDPRLFSTILPVRDGLMVSYKKVNGAC